MGRGPGVRSKEVNLGPGPGAGQDAVYRPVRRPCGLLVPHQPGTTGLPGGKDAAQGAQGFRQGPAKGSREGGQPTPLRQEAGRKGPQAHGFPMEEAVAGGGLQGMPQGVAQVQKAPLTLFGWLWALA